jgi:hypothetical protein
MASSSDIGGRIVGMRLANMVFPAPGGPINKMLCPPYFQRTLGGLLPVQLARLLGFLRFDAVDRQDIWQCDDTFEVMHVGAAYDGQQTQMACPHAIECHVKRMILMDMGKVSLFDKFAQPLATRPIVVCPLQRL